MDEQKVRRLFQWAGWLCVITIAVLSLSPRRVSVTAEFGAPELDHFLAYLFTAGAMALGHMSTNSRFVLCVLLIGFGGILELGQAAIPGRHADFVDFLTNGIGVGVGVAMALLFEKTVLRRTSR